MKTFLILSCLLAVALAAKFDDDWANWKVMHDKKYTGQEEKIRQMIFRTNRFEIAKHNMKYRRGQVTFNMSLNAFADLTESEFYNYFLGMRKRAVAQRPGVPTFRFNSSAPLPDSVDWRTKGVVTAVKRQLHNGKACGSCWAFSTTGSLEGQHALATGKLVSLSEQNLIDCDNEDHGCHGGMMDRAFDWIQKNGGIDTEDSYPYEAVDDTCKFNKTNVGAIVTGQVDVAHCDESALKAAVATIGPISIAIDASRKSFRFYESGVYVDDECSSDSLDHGVLAVGYGTDAKGGDYWIVKNSWGKEWGNEGYIWMARNRDNQCGVSTQASYPKVQ